MYRLNWTTYPEINVRSRTAWCGLISLRNTPCWKLCMWPIAVTWQLTWRCIHMLYYLFLLFLVFLGHFLVGKIDEMLIFLSLLKYLRKLILMFFRTYCRNISLWGYNWGFNGKWFVWLLLVGKGFRNLNTLLHQWVVKPPETLYQSKSPFLLFPIMKLCLTVNSIWGWYHPPYRKKFREKNGKCNQDYFLQVLPKFS